LTCVEETVGDRVIGVEVGHRVIGGVEVGGVEVGDRVIGGVEVGDRVIAGVEVGHRVIGGVEIGALAGSSVEGDSGVNSKGDTGDGDCVNESSGDTSIGDAVEDVVVGNAVNKSDTHFVLSLMHSLQAARITSLPLAKPFDKMLVTLSIYL